jgi:hypothetical protein
VAPGDFDLEYWSYSSRSDLYVEYRFNLGSSALGCTLVGVESAEDGAGALLLVPLLKDPVLKDPLNDERLSNELLRWLEFDETEGVFPL